ncbi:hypothetical protein ZYGR_0A00240 [Zygosaccharomyces rouxii]|uniref:ZYRO0A00506p n=2 Tax=Zygosaccharomyces rouxii TaxID=4956 RepID=C5DP53_ZYGRC|nr:uncharacterized protein ZYRO0A00506g [Zygosaccharomyces rouxii]KAH9199018.1 hypothetical protein LQ764DRAFT_226471 [Zygosaccharomyces rouxii]GAV46433.1 hypothetical protein ZYGR_0A00240 [Zygosaccharomyces rouxii]CAR25464.1 ZYRO0A00506p [Zygosaccharomyces rouxii]
MSNIKQDLSEFDPLTQAETSPKDQNTAGEERTVEESTNRSATVGEKDDGDEDEEPFYDFQLFIQQLRDPHAEPIVRFIKSFLHDFQTVRVLWTAKEQSKLINDFKIFIYDKFGLYKPFCELEGSKLRNAQEGLEKLIMGKLYARCFSPCLEPLEQSLDKEHLQDLKDDRQLKLKSREYRFISPQELDIPNLLSDKLNKLVELSGKELNKVNHFKAPRDKMICVLNSCKIIMAMLTNNKLENGADSFIPLLIYTILKSNLSSLASNTRYIERFRFESFFRGEALYYLNSLQAAVSFIISINESTFTIENRNQFKQRYDDNQKQLIKEDEISERERENNSIVNPRLSKSPNPSQFILQPLDEAANTIKGKVNEFFTSAKPQLKPEDEARRTDTSPPSVALYDEDNQDIDRLAQKLQDREQRNTLSTLKSMFPEMDPEIVEDVCIAKKYRVGATVDILLSL